MSDSLRNLAGMRVGIVLALLTLAYGFGLGGAFGAFEDGIKDHLATKAQGVLDSVYAGDEAAMKKVTDKSWTYFKRAHLHANGLAASTLALILVLSAVTRGRWFAKLAATALGLGSLGYSLFWMLAGLKAPGLGSTGAAKEALEWLAIPSAGLCMVGLAVVLVASLGCLFSKRATQAG